MGVLDKVNRQKRQQLNNPYDIGSVEKQIDNAETRIRFSGYEPKEDKRNWFEKATNLPEGQNFFFDALELIDRPGAAVRNAIDKKGNNAEELWRGFSGQDKTRGTDILDDVGLGNVQNKYAKGVLGFGAEILTDPTMLIPGGAIVKGMGKGAGAVSKVGKGAYNALAPNAMKEALEPAVKGVKDSLGYMFNTKYGRNMRFDQTGKLTESEDILTPMIQSTKNKIDYENTKNMENIVNTAKEVGYDKGDLVGRVMEDELEQFSKTPAYLLPDGIKVENISDVVSTQREIRQAQKAMEKKYDDLYKRTRKEYEQRNVELRNQVDKINKEMQQIFKRYETPAKQRFKRLKNNEGWEKKAEDYAFSKVANDPRFKELDEMRKPLVKQVDDNISQQREALKKVREEGKITANTLQGYLDELEQTKKAPNAEVTRKIERNKQPLPDDPKLTQAAAELMRTNQALREQAKSLGITYPELKGYMRHILSKEEKLRRKTRGQSVYGVDKGNFGIGNPNDKFMQSRKYMGSAEEINRAEGRKIFEPNAFFSTAYGQKQLTEYMHAVDFRRKVLSDPSLAIKWEKGMTVPDGAVKINTKNYQFMKDEDLVEMGLLDEVGGEYVVPTAVKNALDQFQRVVTDEGMKGFLKGFDKAQSWWKRMALFSVPYHLRNDIGAKFNNYVGGMNINDIIKYSAQADKEVYEAMVLGKPSKMYDEYLQQGLGANSQSKVEFALRGDDAAKELERIIKQQSQTGVKKYAGKVLRPFETSRQFGDFVDQTNRYAAYKWARSKGMSPNKAASKVRQTQFDYTDLTNFEREFMTRVVPFYRWMRNNIPYQIRQFVNDPRKFVKVDDFRRNMQSSMGINEENIPTWMTEQFAIPVTGNDDGSGKFLSMNLPVGDLTRVSSPGKMAVDGLSPLAKLPIELTMNRNFFYDRPIERYEGQQEMLNVPFSDRQIGIGKRPAYALENLTGQIGRNTFDYLQPPESQDQDTKFRTPSLGISSVLKDYDVMKSEYYQRLNELQQLQDRINWIEQQTGMRPPTMNEINQQRQSRFPGNQN